MVAFALRRLLSLVPVWLGISLIAFVLATLAPGDPAEFILLQQTGEAPSREAVQALREQLGLNDPLPVQYLRWLGDAVQGDLGISYRSGRPVLSELLSRALVTLRLAIPAMIISMGIALPVGILAAVRRNSIADHFSRFAALAADSIPGYWLGYLLIIVFAVNLHLLPVTGRGTWQHLVLPALTLGVGTTAAVMRLTRSSLLEVLGEDYVTTARAVGVPHRRVVLRHAMKNAAIPVVTVAGLVLGNFLTGTVIIETVFGWPGVGKFVVDSIFDRDYPIIQGFVILAGTMFVLVNLAVDVTSAWLDPRIRFGAREEASVGG